MRYEQMKEQYEELSKIIGKESADKWNELPQDVEDYNRAGRMSVVVVVIIAIMDEVLVIEGTSTIEEIMTPEETSTTGVVTT